MSLYDSFSMGGSFSDTAPYIAPTQGELAGGLTPSSSSSGMGLGSIVDLLGSGLTAFGQYQQGQEIAGAYEYNAAIALQTATYDIGRIDVSEKEYGATQAAMYAKAGVTMSGSPMDTMLKSATNFELDKQVATYNAQSKANMDRYQGAMAKKKAEFDSTMTLISGAAKFAETAGMFAMMA